MIAPLLQPCCHAPTPEERSRDRDYTGCFARPNEPCTWAKRFDAVVDPPYHSERWESAMAVAHKDPTDIMDGAKLRQDILDTGLV